MTPERLSAALITTALALCLPACSASLASRHVDTLDDNGDKEEVHGLFYTLPRTAVGVSLPVTLSETKEGKYGDFADLFFPDEKKLEPKRTLRFKRATFSTRGEPDPRHVYYMRVQGRGAMEQALTFSFSEQGAVTGLKTVTTNKTADVVLAGIGSAASIISKAALAGGEEASLAEDDPCKGPVPDDKMQLEQHFVGCFLKGSPELVANFHRLAADHGDKARNERMRATKEAVLTAYSDIQVAGDGSDRTPVKGPKRLLIEEAREAYLLYRALAKSSNESLKNPLSALDGFSVAFEHGQATMKRLLAQFIGVKQPDQEWTGVFEVLPEECDEARVTPCTSWSSQALIKYFPDQGLCEVDQAALVGSSPPATVKAPAAADCEKASALELSLKRGRDEDQLVLRVARNFKRPVEAGMHYVVPAQMLAEVVASEAGTRTPEEIEPSKDHLMIAQHGIVTAMPAKLGGKAMTHDVTFYPASGALKSYNLLSTPMIDKGLADSLGGAVNTVLDAQLKQEQAEAAAADPVNQVKKEKELLEALLAIQKACAELDNPPEMCGGG